MKTILLIEDNSDIRNNTAEILELANYIVFVAENGKVGVEKALYHKPDLIVCDIMMPVLDGYGVLHAVHKNADIKNTPFIFLTAKTERIDFRKGMELGADDYITKPFDATELLNAIDSRLKKIEILKENITPDINGVTRLLQASVFGSPILSTIENRDTNKYKKKQIIYSAGNRPYQLFYVVKGKVKSFNTTEDGKDLVTGLYGEKEFIGYVSLLEETVYNDSAEALEDTELAIISKEDFDILLNNNSGVARKFIQLLAKNVADKEHQLLSMAYSSLRRKVADAILLLQKKFGGLDDKDFMIDISRESLATIAGTATESLIRTLSDFKAEQMIDISHGKIKILNQKKLTNLIN